MTNLKTRLSRLAAVIAEQASRDPEFARKIEAIIGSDDKPLQRGTTEQLTLRRKGRRALPVLDPMDIAQSGADALREALGPLDVDQLLDIVAEYGMDPGKLVMKWKERERIRDRIIEVSLARTTKGDAFRSG